jgi:hypothetical protein
MIRGEETMKRRIITELAILGFFISSQTLLFATGVITDFSSLIHNSQAVVVGVVTDHTSFMKKGKVFTQYTIGIEDDIVATLNQSEITVIVPGGKYGNVGQEISIAPDIRSNERALFFLQTIEGYSDAFWITDFVGGKFDIISTENIDLISNDALFNYLYGDREVSEMQKFKLIREDSRFNLEHFKEEIKNAWINKR